MISNEVLERHLGKYRNEESFVYSFGDGQLAIGTKLASPFIYNIETKAISQVESGAVEKVDPITGLAFSHDNAYLVSGYKNGHLVLWNLKDRKIAVRYRLINENPITNFAFVEGHTRIMLSDSTGIISLISIVESLSCQLVLMTTLINLKNPVLAFKSLGTDHVAFGSVAGVTVLRNNVSVEALFNKLPPFAEPISLDLSSRNKLIRVMYSTVSECTIVELNELDLKSQVLSKSFAPKKIIRCFFIEFDKLLLIFDDLTTSLMSDTGEILQQTDNIPADVTSNNIFLYNKTLVLFGNDKCTEIPMKTV